MKKSLPKQSATISSNLVVFRPFHRMSTERVSGQYYLKLQLESHVLAHMLPPIITRKSRARRPKLAHETAVVIKTLNTYSVLKDPTRPYRSYRLIDNYTRKQFPLSRSERKMTAVALVQYSKNHSVYLTLKQAVALVRLYETMLKGVNYLINECVDSGYHTDKHFIEQMFKRPVWLYTSVRIIFNMMHAAHEDGMTLEDQIENCLD